MNPMIFRLLTLMTHYRKPLDFTQQRIDEATKILKRWLDVCVYCDGLPPVEVLQFMCNDLNTPGLIAQLHVYRNQNRGKELYASLKFLGFFDCGCLPDEWKMIPEDQLGDIQPGPAVSKSMPH